MQSQRDQNIVEAWQKGGMFEGRKVTDDMILKHWQERSKQVDKNDPLYDTYHNAFMEYDYSINESIMRTKYAQGTVSDAAAAQFYLNWSKKVPKNSEFWRVLQRDAAEFTRASKAKSEAAAAREKEIRYQNDLKAIDTKDVAPGTYLLDVFKNIAKRGLRPNGGNPLIDPSNGELYQFDAGDVEDMLGMITRMTDYEDPRSGKAGTVKSPTANVLYHDDNGNPVTGASVMAQLKKMVPGFTGQLTLDHLYTLVSQQRAGLQKQQKLAEETGHLSDAKKYADQLSVNAELGREIKAWPVEQNYLNYREAMLKVVNDPSASAFDKQQAVESYRTNLTKLSNDPSIATNDVFRNKLLGEAKGDEGTTTAAEDFTGLNNVQPQDTKKINIAYNRSIESIDAVNAGEMVWTTGEWEKPSDAFPNGRFIPGAGGSTIGAATPQDIQNNSGGIPTQTVYMPDKGGRFAPVAVMGQPVTIHAIDPKTNTELPVQSGTNSTVATIYAFPGGQQMVSYKDGQGHTLWSALKDAPWGGGAKLTESSKGFDLTITAPATQDQVGPLGFKVQAGPNGKPVLTYNPQAAMLATDPDHAKVITGGGGDPHTDFRSANIAFYTAVVDGFKMLYSLSGNPQFKKQVDIDNHVSVGFTPAGLDANGNIVWNQDGDMNQLNRGAKQADAFYTPGSAGGGAWEAANGLNDRSTPASQLAPDMRYEGYDSATAAQLRAADSAFANANPLGYSTGAPDPLASAALVGTPFEKMTNHLQTGTLTPNPNWNDHGSSGINDIKLGGTSIRVPGAPNISPQTGFTLPSANLNPQSGSSTVGGGMVNPTPLPQQTHKVAGGGYVS